VHEKGKEMVSKGGRERSRRENAYKMEQGGKRTYMMALQNINLFLTF